MNFERLNLNWCTVLAVRMLRGFKDSGNMTAVEYDAFAMHMMCLPSFRVAPALKLNMNLSGATQPFRAILDDFASLGFIYRRSRMNSVVLMSWYA